MIRKRTMMRLAFTAEVMLFSWFYYYGVCGMKEIYQLQQENDGIEQHIEMVQRDIVGRECELKSWLSDPFYKEKWAREQLHMAKEGEEIYLY